MSLTSLYSTRISAWVEEVDTWHWAKSVAVLDCSVGVLLGEIVRVHTPKSALFLTRVFTRNGNNANWSTTSITFQLSSLKKAYIRLGPRFFF
jgi:hypothetical protein